MKQDLVINNIMNADELRALLVSHNIPFEQWNTGEAKSFEHLLTELRNGEATLIEENDKLLRLVLACVLEVYHKDTAGMLKIMEEKQVFTDGRVRVRDYLAGGLFEKMEPNEKPEATAERALREELGITQTLPLVRKADTLKGPVPSVSFPGLTSIFKFYNFDVFLPKRDYRPDGYIEIQKDKSSYFIWQKC